MSRKENPTQKRYNAIEKLLKKKKVSLEKAEHLKTIFFIDHNLHTQRSYNATLSYIQEQTGVTGAIKVNAYDLMGINRRKFDIVKGRWSSTLFDLDQFAKNKKLIFANELEKMTPQEIEEKFDESRGMSFDQWLQTKAGKKYLLFQNKASKKSRNSQVNLTQRQKTVAHFKIDSHLIAESVKPVDQHYDGQPPVQKLIKNAHGLMVRPEDVNKSPRELIPYL